MSIELKGAVETALRASVRAFSPIAGGDINQAYAFTLSGGERVFVKTREQAPAGMYAREAEGLLWLAETGALRVPRVIVATDSLLVLEWVESKGRGRDFDEQLGRGLALMHRYGAPSFGFARDNFIGPLPQANTPLARWDDFYRERRLAPLVSRGVSSGRIDVQLRHAFDRLFERLEQLVGPSEPPARLHGDLWSGNVHTDECGSPVLIDPAVYGGHREIDLAMLSLFGGCSTRLLAAYDEVHPRAAGHDERVMLYQLYPLLVHLCLFGASYRAPLASALERYA